MDRKEMIDDVIFEINNFMSLGRQDDCRRHRFRIHWTDASALREVALKRFEYRCVIRTHSGEICARSIKTPLELLASLIDKELNQGILY